MNQIVCWQAMVLTDCRDQLECYGIDTALKYLDGKLTENAVKRLLGENTMFNEVSDVYCLRQPQF